MGSVHRLVHAQAPAILGVDVTSRRMADGDEWGALTEAVAAALKDTGSDGSLAKQLAGFAGSLAPAALRAVVSAFGRYANRNTKAMQDAWDARRFQWIIESCVLLDRDFPQLKAAVAHIENIVDALDDRMKRLELATERSLDPEFQRILDNYGIEASREAIDERLRMLTHATAGSFSAPMTIAELSRVERILRELDPPDITVLRTLEVGVHSPMHIHGFEVLVGAGCAIVSWGGAGGLGNLAITETGRRVLSLLRSYDPPA